MLPQLRDKIEGLLLGSMIGDAAGGPVEFKTREEVVTLVGPKRVWQRDQELNEDAIIDLAESFELLPYKGIRPKPAAYGQWTPDAPAGTVTDDTRIKIPLFRALDLARRHNGFPVSAADLAARFIMFRENDAVLTHEGYPALCEEWLEELNRSARWVLGERNLNIASPPERLWGGLATCCGQMILPPLAAIYPGDPIGAYKAAYSLGFFDNGPAKDMNAAIVAGLAGAQVHSESDRAPAWEQLYLTMEQTDPYSYGKVPWVERSVTRWLRFSDDAVRRADRRPARLFEILEEELHAQTWWEAHVPFVTVIACLRLCDHVPLAAMQLCLDFRHDTDSGAQLLGAMAGAIHGKSIFPEPMRDCVAQRFEEDYGESVDAWVDLLISLQNRDRYSTPIAFL